MTSALGRLKRGVRAAIDGTGGIDGAAATARRCRSVAGDWNNLNHPAFPPLDCALALDEVAIAKGAEPQLVTHLARELGGVFVPLPDAHAVPDTLAGRVLELTARLGALSQRMRDALADGVICAVEAGELRELSNELAETNASLRLALEAIANQAAGGGE